jgi:NADH-quinone oxidoreductase subunit C
VTDELGHVAGNPTPDTDTATIEPLAGSEVATPDAGAEVLALRTGAFGVTGSGDTTGFAGLVEPVTLPSPAERPFGGWFDEATDELELALGEAGQPAVDAIERIVIDRGELTYYVRREYLRNVLQTLRDEPALRFEYFSGVSGVHYPQHRGRELHAVYHLASFTHNRRVRVEVTCPDADPRIPSAVPVYPNADWHERETWDFFGIVFEGHPFLTRIEMPDDWDGHPQRKDYPLGGVPVEYKGATTPPPDERRGYH